MPWTLNPLLGAGSGGTLFQLLFVIVMIIGWVIKTIAESRGRTPQSRRTPPRTREPSAPGPSVTSRVAEAVDLGGDVVYGTRPLRHPPGSRESPPLPARAEPAAPPPAPARASAGTRVPGPRTLEVTAVTAGPRRGLRREAALRRLGVLEMRVSVRRRTRAGVLWSEVLGTPRAIRGPHQAPTFDRMRSSRK